MEKLHFMYVMTPTNPAAEAQRFFEAEPFIKRGFATGTLHPYRIAISRNEL